MTALRLAAQQALEPVAAVAKNATAQFDHGIGADRFKVVRGAYWWHVLIGDSQTKRGKFHTQAGAEEMAALLLREFRNGAFVQHEAALAQQAEPVDGACLHGVDDGACKECYAASAEPVEPVATLTAQRDALLEALKMMTAHYCNLVNSGDAGNWEPDAEPEVQIARAAIKAVEETK